MPRDLFEKEHRVWTFSLPTGEVETIKLPEEADIDWQEKFEHVLEQIEKIYPYMGFRPGVILPELRSQGYVDGTPEEVLREVLNLYANPVANGTVLGAGLQPSTNTQGNLNRNFGIETLEYKSLSDIRYGLNDVIPQGFATVGEAGQGSTVGHYYVLPGASAGALAGEYFTTTIGFYAPTSSTAARFIAVRYDATSAVDGKAYAGGTTPAESSSTNESMRGSFWALVLWWPPEEYACVVANEDVLYA